jgi:hypothetical protein
MSGGLIADAAAGYLLPIEDAAMRARGGIVGWTTPLAAPDRATA